MSETATDITDPPAKSGKIHLVIVVVLAVLGAGGGFFAVQKGIVPIISSPKDHSQNSKKTTMKMHKTDDIAFVEIDPIMISLTGNGQVHHLRFRAQLEVGKEDKSDVIMLLPRVVDVLNGYLRALELDDFRDPLALTRLRGQMLRRVQIVVGKERVRDLLIMDFVLN